MGLAIGLNLLWLGEQAGGVGRYAVELVRALREVEPESRITAFVRRGLPPGLHEIDAGDAVDWVAFPDRLTTPPLHLASEALALPVLAVARRLDVVHNPAAGPPAVVPGVATVVTMHDLMWLHQRDAWGDRRAQRATRRVQTQAARRCDRIVADSQASRDDLITSLGVEAERVDVVPLGVREPSVAPTGEDELRGRIGIGPGPVILCVAQKRPYKNLESLVRCVATLRDIGIQLVLPGAPTSYEEELRRLAAELLVSDRVHLPPWVSDAELERLYRMAACFVLPSRMEGFGLPVLEAMVRGVPVACSNTWALPEVAGDAGLLFDPDDQESINAAVGRLVGDRGLATELGERGRQRAQRFSWRRTAAGTLATYRRAIDQRRGARRR